MLSNVQNRTNLHNQIWNIKKNIGDHQQIENISNEFFDFEQRNTLKIENDRCFYHLGDVNVDSEITLSLIMEYLYYLSNKTYEDRYENVASIAEKNASIIEYPIISVFLCEFANLRICEFAC